MTGLPPGIGLPLIALLVVALATALGLGPTLLLVDRSVRSRLLLVPVVGLAFGTTVLASLAMVVPLDPVAVPVLAVWAVASVAIGVRRLRREGDHDGRVVSAGGAIALLGIGLALLPLLRQGTYGPVDLFFMDSWFYVALDDFLAQAPITETTADPAVEPAASFVQVVQANDTRMGIDAFRAAAFTLLGISPVQGSGAAQAAVVGMVPLVAVAAARDFLSLTRSWSAVAGVLALSPVTVQLFADPRPANMAAIAFAVPALWFAYRALTSAGGWRDAAVAGLATSALAVTYTEHLPTLVAAGGLAWLVALVAGPERRQLVRRTIRMAGVVLVAAVLVSPGAAVRAGSYAAELAGGGSLGAPAYPGVRYATALPLTTGTSHLHELYKVDLVSTPRLVALAALTALFVALIALGAWSLRRRGAVGVVCVAVPVVSLALFAYFLSQGECGDCVYKSVTLTPPWIALLVAAGGSALAATAARPLGPRWGTAVGVIAVAVCIAAQARATVDLENAAARVPAALDDPTAQLPDALRPLPGSVLLEGAEAATGNRPFFDVPAALQLASLSDRPLRWDPRWNQYVGGFNLPPSMPEDYRYVATRWPGLTTGRRRIGRAGEYAIEEAAPVDVSIASAPGTRDPADPDAAARPWLRGPIVLAVTGAQRGATIRVAVTGPAAARASFAVQPGRLAVTRTGDRADLCVRLGPGARRVRLTLSTDFSAPAPPRSPVDEPERPPRALGLVGLTAARGRPADCRAARGA